MWNIDPDNITDYNRSDRELQGLLIACMCVAGKMAKIWFPKTNDMLNSLDETFGAESLPFSSLGMQQRLLGNGIQRTLEAFKIGNYKQLTKKIETISLLIDTKKLDLRTCTVNQLSEIVGHKTARFFVLHSRPNVEIACLDTHIRAWLRENGYPTAPKAAPTKTDKYEYWEHVFLEECRKRGVADIAKFDLEIWRSKRRDPQTRSG